MVISHLKTALVNGAGLVFAKHLNEEHHVRYCHVIVFGRRKGFHVVEQSLKQLREMMENEGGIFILHLKDDKMLPVTPSGEELIRELTDEEMETYFQKLPHFDLTTRVQSQHLLKKIGFFR